MASIKKQAQTGKDLKNSKEDVQYLTFSNHKVKLVDKLNDDF